MQLKSLAKVFVWNTIFILAGIIIIELFFGSWFSSNQLNNLNILRNRIWHYDIDYPGVADNEREIIYSRDRWGLRGDYGEPEDITILTIGGSTTDQRYISDGWTWQDVMMRNFNASELAVGVANAGVDGRTTFGHQHDFDLWFPKIKNLRPRYVLLYVGINDMYFTQPHVRFDQAHSDVESLVVLMKRNSVVYSLLQALIGTYKVETRNIGHSTIDYANALWTDSPKRIIKKEVLAERLELYAKRYQLLLEEIADMGAIPIVVTQPRGDARLIDGRIHGIDYSNSDTTTINDELLGALNSQTANGLDYHQILSHFNQT